MVAAFDTEGPVQAEVFVLWLADGRRLHLTGPCGAEPWYIEVGADDDPVEVVSDLVHKAVGEPLVVHSTSWRSAADGVILSFVVVVDDESAVRFGSIPVPRAELARSEATAAPAAIGSEQVIEHGLRHLAWLAKEDPVVRAKLEGDWAAALEDYVPEPFQNLR